MKTTANLSFRPAGHGHYEITVEVNGKVYSSITSYMTLIDQAKDRDDTACWHARCSLVESCLDANSITYSDVSTYESRNYGTLIEVDLD